MFTGRHAGMSAGRFASLNCSFDVGDDPATVSANRALVAGALGISRLMTLRQVHSDAILPSDTISPDNETVTGDALTAVRPAAVGIKVADCLPVYLYALDGGAVGLAHCGWRGTAARLAQKAANALARAAGRPVTALAFSLGPCICGRCYSVGADVHAALAGLPGADNALVPGPGPDRWRLDLRAANRAQLSDLGLLEYPGLELCSLENAAACYSVRRDPVTGRNLALTALAPT